ncbi:MAG: hypothetical protein H0U27_08515 [Nitrosopumilus sp.]|nr:hypothetical protein [Nitrosopumilus sp.]
MINSVSIALNISISCLAFEDSINNYYYVYKRNPSTKNGLFFLLEHTSAFASASNCYSNSFKLGDPLSRAAELICKVSLTGLNIFHLMKKWDREQAVPALGNALCAARVFYEMSKSLAPSNVFHYDLCWQSLAILEIASRILLISIRKTH